MCAEGVRDGRRGSKKQSSSVAEGPACTTTVGEDADTRKDSRREEAGGVSHPERGL